MIMNATVTKGRWYPEMPPALPGEDGNRYTDRLAGYHGQDQTPYDHVRYRECSLGWHATCSQNDHDPARSGCECPHHTDPTFIALREHGASEDTPEYLTRI
jgi:hypothetical protein